MRSEGQMTRYRLISQWSGGSPYQYNQAEPARGQHLLASPGLPHPISSDREKIKCRVVRSSISSLAQVVQHPPKSCALTCFPKKYSPSLYFPLMYISPYRNQGFCLPPDHSHLKLGTLPCTQKEKRIYPLPSKPLLRYHHHQNKQHLISPRH